jgi:NitT/TauT family transport system permease protein
VADPNDQGAPPTNAPILAKSPAAIPAPAAPQAPGRAIAAPRVVGAHSKESIWTLRRALPRSMQIPFMIALPSFLFALWCALTLRAHPVSIGHIVLDPLFLPSPVAVLRSLVRMSFDGTLAANISASVFRIVVSFFLAAAIAVPLGVLMGAFEPVNRLFEPIMAPLRYLPISAFIPLLILWLGIHEAQKIAFLFLGVFVYLLPVVVTAIRAVPEELVQTALTLGASPLKAVWTVLVPAALPDIFDSFRVMNAISWTYVILAEIVNASSGLGYMIELAGAHLKTDEIFAGILVIGVIGLATDALIRFVNGILFGWREGTP